MQPTGEAVTADVTSAEKDRPGLSHRLDSPKLQNIEEMDLVVIRAVQKF